MRERGYDIDTHDAKNPGIAPERFRGAASQDYKAAMYGVGEQQPPPGDIAVLHEQVNSGKYDSQYGCYFLSEWLQLPTEAQIAELPEPIDISNDEVFIKASENFRQCVAEYGASAAFQAPYDLWAEISYLDYLEQRAFEEEQTEEPAIRSEYVTEDKPETQTGLTEEQRQLRIALLEADAACSPEYQEAVAEREAELFDS